MAGKWTSLENQPTFNATTMLLLTDGRVICHEGKTKNWWALTPDPSGSYIKGKWNQIASFQDNAAIPALQGGPQYAPLYYVSAVLKDGRVLVAGGTYNGKYDAKDEVLVLAAQIYDPTSDIWSNLATPTGWTNIGNAPFCVLADGRVLLGELQRGANTSCLRTSIYDPFENVWTDGGNKLRPNFEETWTLLPDGNVLTVDRFSPPGAEKYVTANDQWVDEASPVSLLLAGIPLEMGPAILLPDRRVFAIGAVMSTGLYTSPEPPAQIGTWVDGPQFPKIGETYLGAAGLPACLLPNGRVFCAVSTPREDLPFASLDPMKDIRPTYFYEFDSTAFDAGNVSLTDLGHPTNNGTTPYIDRMLLLPTGQVLFSNGTQDIEAYEPDGAPDPNWAPQVSGWSLARLSPGRAYTVNGRSLTGLSQAVSLGASSGATNYPLVRITFRNSGHCYYCKTFNFSSMAVAETTPQSFQFAVPATMVEIGLADMVIVTNGISSAPIPLDQRPSLWGWLVSHKYDPSAGVRSHVPSNGSVKTMMGL